VGGEDLLAGLLVDAVGQRELEVLDEELLDVWAADVIGLLNLNDLENLDVSETRSMASSHILVESIDSGDTGQFTVLLVHVVGAGARVVTDPDAEVLDFLGALLVDLVDGNDLTVRLLDLPQLAEKVPEPRLGDDLVGRKDTHTVDLGGRVGL